MSKRNQVLKTPNYNLSVLLVVLIFCSITVFLTFRPTTVVVIAEITIRARLVFKFETQSREKDENR